MPKISCVNEEEAIDAVVAYIDNFRTNIFPKSTAQLWKDMSKNCCNGKWSYLSWYATVTGDRRQILSIARQRKGINVPSPEPTPTLNETVNDSRHEKSDQEESDSEVDENVTKLWLPLTSEVWNQIKPIELGEFEESKTKHSLRPRVWTNILNDIFYETYRMPCAFVFRRGNVYTSPNRKYYVKIIGHCRDKTCANPFLGIADNEPCPITGKLMLLVKTRDTYHTPHAPVSRPCNGEKRKLVGRRALGEGSYNTRNNMARETTRRGETVAPSVPSLDVIRHAKREVNREDLGLKKKAKTNPIHVVEDLQFQKPYFGTISHVSTCPFYVIYGSDEQIESYREYCRINRQEAVITIDSSGSMIRKLNRPMGLKSGHIFLFSIVINFSKTILSVFQMISECQESEAVIMMLGAFIRRAGVKPKRCISDNSKTLLLSESITFNGCKTSQYLEKLFIAVQTKTLTPRTMATFLFTDVAHFIHAASKWNIFKNLQLAAVKDFFIRALALMVDCQTLDDFKELFYLTCLVALQSHEDSQLASPYASSVRDARVQLQKFMAARPIDDNGFVDYNAMQKLEDYDPEVTIEEELDSPKMTSFINAIIVDAGMVSSKGRELNAYYLPELIKDLKRVGREFLLWTAVGNPFYMGHHSSSSSEANFSILKDKVFKQQGLPQRVDNFLMIHLRSLTGEQINFHSNLKHFLNQDKYVSSPLVKDLPSKRKNDAREIIHEEEMEKRKRYTENINDEPVIQGHRGSSNEMKRDLENDVDDAKWKKGRVDLDDCSSEDDFFSREDWRRKGEPFFFVNKQKDNDRNRHPDDCTEKIPGHGEKKKDSAAPQKVYLNGIDEEILPNNLEINSEILEDNIPIFSSSGKNDGPSFDSNVGDSGTVINSTIADSEQIDGHTPSILTEEDLENVALEHDYLRTPVPKEASKVKRSHAKFFRDCPEIQYRDPNRRNRKTKTHLLPHSTKCRSVAIDDTTYVKNSCPFDSLVQILYTTVLHDTCYQSFLKQSKSPLAEFVLSFRDKGPCEEIYTKRAQLLLPLYPLKANKEVLTSKFVSTINAHGSPNFVWSRLMSGEPSVMRSILCPNPRCGNTQQRIHSWCPDLRSTKRQGYRCLQRTLEYYPMLWNVQCSCGGLKQEENISNAHVLLELDLRTSSEESAETCLLYDIPPALTFNRDYRLAGIIAYYKENDHFVAYCRRQSGSWEIHNGLLSKVNSVRGNPKIQPDCAIYIMNQHET